MARAVTIMAAGIAVLAASGAEAQTLRGSSSVMQRQNRVAVQHDYTFLETASQVRKFVDSGYLVRVPGNSDYRLAAVSYPYARPAVKVFIERLAKQYHSACGEALVVTSLTRPVSEQPRNASDLSVHPAGMALDLRVPQRTKCRSWLERTLLSLEKQGVLDATRESRPPHFHVALFPEPYARYVAEVTGRPASAILAAVTRTVRSTAEAPARTSVATAVRNASPDRNDAQLAAADATSTGAQQYRVNRGDSLWSIARRHGTTVDTLKELNGLRSTRITAGQVIRVPVTVAVGAEDSD